MKLWITLLLCMLLGVPAVQANPLSRSLRNLEKLLSRPATQNLSFTTKRILVERMAERTNKALVLKRLNLTPAQVPVFERSVRSYHKTVSLHFPEVAAKPMGTAANTLEDLIMDLPLSLKEENVFIQTIPGIIRPTEAYMTAMFADAWSGWLESGLAPQPPAEMVVSRADIKRARAMQRDLSAKFDELYANLPAEQKDLNAQLKRVMEEVRVQTGWDDETIANLERYFAGVLKPMISHMDKLTAVEFLQAYDVLAVAGEMGERFLHRVEKGSSTFVPFLLNESINRVKSRLPERFAPAGGSARSQRLQKWYKNVYAPSPVPANSPKVAE